MNDYDKRIKELEDKLYHLHMQKQYGLTWEKDINKVKNLKIKIKENTSKTIANSKYPVNHFLIEGDNYFALEYLKKGIY